MKMLEERLTEAGDELRHAADRMPPMSVPQPRPLRSALAFVAGAVAVLLLVAVPAWLLSGAGSNGRWVADSLEGEAGVSNVFMLPGFVPDGFSLSNVQLVDADGRGTDEPSEAAGTVLQYRPQGSIGFRFGEPSLTVEVTDLLATYGSLFERQELQCYDGDGEPAAEDCRGYLAGSACVGEEAKAAGELEPEACIAEERESVRGRFGEDAEVDFEETTVRGLPAQITRVTSPEPGYVSVTTYEGGPVVSIVTGHLVDQANLIRVADLLRPVSPGEFEEETTRALEEAARRLDPCLDITSEAGSVEGNPLISAGLDDRLFVDLVEGFEAGGYTCSATGSGDEGRLRGVFLTFSDDDGMALVYSNIHPQQSVGEWTGWLETTFADRDLYFAHAGNVVVAVDQSHPHSGEVIERWESATGSDSAPEVASLWETMHRNETTTMDPEPSTFVDTTR